MTSIGLAVRATTPRLQLKHIAFVVFAIMVAFVVYGRDLQLLDPVQNLGQVGLVSVVWSCIAIALFLPSFAIALQASLASRRSPNARNA